MKPCELVENVQTIFEISSGKLAVNKKYIFIVKNLTDFHKTLETSMDPHLIHMSIKLCSKRNHAVKFCIHKVVKGNSDLTVCKYLNLALFFSKVLVQGRRQFKQ